MKIRTEINYRYESCREEDVNGKQGKNKKMTERNGKHWQNEEIFSRIRG